MHLKSYPRHQMGKKHRILLNVAIYNTFQGQEDQSFPVRLSPNKKNLFTLGDIMRVSDLKRSKSIDTSVVNNNMIRCIDPEKLVETVIKKIDSSAF